MLASSGGEKSERPIRTSDDTICGPTAASPADEYPLNLQISLHNEVPNVGSADNKSLTLLEIDTSQLRLYNPTIFYHPHKNMEIFSEGW